MIRIAAEESIWATMLSEMSTICFLQEDCCWLRLIATFVDDKRGVVRRLEIPLAVQLLEGQRGLGNTAALSTGIQFEREMNEDVLE